MSSGNTYHVSVLLGEVLNALNIREDGTYVDCTFGGGGHSSAILDRLGQGGRLIAFDQDKDAARNVPQDPRITFIPHNFRHLRRFLRLHKAIPVDGILADLGVSSFQIDTAARGFSTRFEGELNMRMDQSGQYTAADVLNKKDASELQYIFQAYGEVTNARTLASAIVEARALKPFRLLSDLNNVLEPLAKGNPQRYFAQVYQAIRIEVNDELGALAELLEQAVDVLSPGGRIAIITFHSLEDRIVKNFFRFENVEGIRHTDEFGRAPDPKLRVVTKKPLLPQKEEQKNNPRSRSAKLRIAEKI